MFSTQLFCFSLQSNWLLFISNCPGSWVVNDLLNQHTKPQTRPLGETEGLVFLRAPSKTFENRFLRELKFSNGFPFELGCTPKVGNSSLLTGYFRLADRCLIL